MAVSARDIERYLTEEEPFKLIDGPATIAFEPVGSGCWRITAMRNGHFTMTLRFLGTPVIDDGRIVAETLEGRIEAAFAKTMLVRTRTIPVPLPSQTVEPETKARSKPGPKPRPKGEVGGKPFKAVPGSPLSERRWYRWRGSSITCAHTPCRRAR